MASRPSQHSVNEQVSAPTRPRDAYVSKEPQKKPDSAIRCPVGRQAGKRTQEKSGAQQGRKANI